MTAEIDITVALSAEFASFSWDLTLDDIKRLSVEVAEKIAAKHRTLHQQAA